MGEEDSDWSAKGFLGEAKLKDRGLSLRWVLPSHRATFHTPIGDSQMQRCSQILK